VWDPVSWGGFAWSGVVTIRWLFDLLLRRRVRCGSPEYQSSKDTGPVTCALGDAVTGLEWLL